MTAAERRLRDPERFHASMRSFQWLGTAATGATDIDCLIERRGEVLILEGKTWHAGITVPLGQHIALKVLATKPGFTVYLVGEAGTSADGEGAIYWTMRYGLPAPLYISKRGAYFPAGLFVRRTRDEMRELVTDWESRC